MCVETLCPQQSTSFIKIELMFKQMLKQFAREHSICYSEGYSAVKRNVFSFFVLETRDNASVCSLKKTLDCMWPAWGKHMVNSMLDFT